MHKHVFLVGQMDPVVLKEFFATQPMRVIVHDNDEYTGDEDAEQNFSVG